jgi:hypothetical protein
MANPDEVPFSRTVNTQAGAVGTAGNDLDTVLYVVPEDGVVTAVTYTTPTAITGANTNSRTVSVINKGAAGSGSTSVASLALTSGVNTVAFVPKTITVSGTAANLNVTAGDVLVFNSLHVGTGIADTGGLVRVSIDRR